MLFPVDMNAKSDRFSPVNMANFLGSRRGIVLIGVFLVVVLVAVIIVVFASQPKSDEGSSFIVTVEEGLLQGHWVESEQGRGYVAYRGVPYAAPPIGDLRFKGPRPPQRWGGVRNASQEGPMCYQASSDHPEIHEGSEDCLYMNIYSPLNLEKNESKLPVYFFIHGGAYMGGSSTASLFGPEFFMQQDIIVVTMNYRLGVFGFLSLDTEDVPGNVGLKDMVASLRWVYRNINAFGGDPERITIGGESSGGSCASWLSILPETKGLIAGAVIHSSSAIHGWALNRSPLVIAEETARILGGKNVKDKTEITRLVKNAERADLLDASFKAASIMDGRMYLGNELYLPFAPTLELREPGSESILIKRDAESYMIKPETNDIPLIVGVTKDEGQRSFVEHEFGTNEKLQEEIEHLRTFIPISIVPDPETKRILGIESAINQSEILDTEKKLIDHYFLSNTIENCTNACKMGKFYDLSLIVADSAHFEMVRATYSNKPTFAYLFSLKSDYTLPMLPNTPDFLKNAVPHGDDINYMWKKNFLKQEYYGESVASKALRRMVTFVANFATFGNPTPLDNSWEPIVNAGKPTYLEINENLTQRYQSVTGSDSALWSGIFSQYRRNKSP